MFVGIDAVNVMAAYHPVAQACGSTPKHVGASVINDFIVVCISWNNKKYFDTTEARYKHEDGGIMASVKLCIIHFILICIEECYRRVY